MLPRKALTIHGTVGAEGEEEVWERAHKGVSGAWGRSGLREVLQGNGIREGAVKNRAVFDENLAKEQSRRAVLGSVQQSLTRLVCAEEQSCWPNH